MSEEKKPFRTVVYCEAVKCSLHHNDKANACGLFYTQIDGDGKCARQHIPRPFVSINSKDKTEVKKE